MAVLLPFQAFRSHTPATYVPGKESPPDSFEGAGYAPEPEAALFRYRQRFRFPGGSQDSVREGVMGLLNRAEATVFPHEETFPGAVADCSRLLRSPRRDLGSIWLWCNDGRGALAPLLQDDADPLAEATDSFGCMHQLWPIRDAARISAIEAALAGQPLFIADGHHRYAAGWKLVTIQIRTGALRTMYPPLTVDEIEANARRGILLPPKTTDFYPKLLAGLVVHRHQNENVIPTTAQRPGVRNPSS